jgi:putative RecB family exonuclease
MSPSSCSSFKECPLAFRFSYLERLPEPPAPWTTKGTLVHRALELLLDRPADERSLDAALADLAAARVELAPHPDFAGLDLTEAEWAQFDTDAESLVRKYFELEDPRTVRPIGLELKLEADLGRTRLRGIIDRLELDEHGEFVVTDYKTGSVPSEFWEAKSLSGVHIYALLCERMLGKRPARVQLMYLSKPELIIATPTDQSIRGVERKTSALQVAIKTACERDDFRPHPGRLCDWCSFKPYCPAYGGNPIDAAELRGPGTVIAPPLPISV